MKTDLKELIEVSRKYGSDPDWILVGGGNTSMKQDGVLYVKASGFELASIDEKGFVAMSMDKLEAVWGKNYPADEKERESEVLADMMNARLEGQTSRPSVEALLHSLIKGRLVVHTHPSLVNGLTCAVDGEKMAAELFGDDALWIPSTNPGYILAVDIKQRIEASEAAGKAYPQMILLQNHGLFVVGENPDESARIHSRIAASLKTKLKKSPAPEVAPVDTAAFKSAAEKAWGRAVEVSSAVNDDVLSLAETQDAFSSVRLPFNPDQIVYSGPGPLRIESIDQLVSAVGAYTADWKREPQAVFVKDAGLFCIGDTEKKASSALALMLDAVKIAVYAESFGGALPMTKDLIIFIRDWEVEHYRAKVSK